MKSDGQRQPETTGLTPLMSTRTINVGTWNVMPMYETGKTAQVAADMMNYKFALWNTRTMVHHGNLQNQAKEDQDECQPVLLTNQW